MLVFNRVLCRKIGGCFFKLTIQILNSDLTDMKYGTPKSGYASKIINKENTTHLKLL